MPSENLLRKYDSNPHWSQGTVILSQQTHEAFARGALGATGERIWRLILTEPLRAVEIARRLQTHCSNVSRALVKLEAHGLAFADAGKRWAGNPAGADDLNSVAAHYGTLGKAERRKEQHKRERARDVSEAILRRKRAWENKQHAEERRKHKAQLERGKVNA